MSQSVVHHQIVSALVQAAERSRQKGSLTTSSWPTPRLELAKREDWGDLSTNFAMTVAPMERKSPQVIAEILAEQLQATSDVVERVDVAPPGFMNLTIRRSLWFEVLREIEEKGALYGHSSVGNGKRILCEYVSANPTGPLHVGHGRGAALGDSLSRILKAAGYSVEREYYINDAGRQMKLLGASVYAKYQEQFGRTVTFPDDGYQGKYIHKVAEQIAARLGPVLLDIPSQEAEGRCTSLAHEEFLDEIKRDLRAFGVEFDSWFSEQELFSSGKIQNAIQDLSDRDLVHEEDGALWFRSTCFNDEKDRVVRKQDGDYTYLASDIAYHYDKLKRGFEQLINVWGADHHGYVPRLQGVVQAFGYPQDRLRVVLVQMVSLSRGGKKIEMSKRSGEFVTMREVIDEVGADAARFFFLMRRSDTHLEFDLELAQKQSTENPVYYVQYAYARLASVFRVAQDRGVAAPMSQQVDLNSLDHKDEIRLIKNLSNFPGVVHGCAVALEPHRLTFYLQELAGLLHTYYYHHRVLPASTDSDLRDGNQISGHAEAEIDSGERQPVERLTAKQTAARLVLMRQVQTVLHNGLSLLGVSAPERM